MKVILATLAAAGIFALFTIPARADATAAPNDVSNAATATVEHTDVSARRRHWRHYGYRRIGVLLHRDGWQVNHKRVLRLMREDNLLCLRRRPFAPLTTNSRHGWEVVPNLARGMRLSGTDQLWVADITYVRLAESFVYLAVILDAFSRKVIR